MAEYIGCRNCGSPNCKGCNIYTLATMLNNGKFDCLMDSKHSVNPWADVVEVGHGFNIYGHDSAFECSVCGFSDWDTMTADSGKYNYCPNCGAKMDGERKETE